MQLSLQQQSAPAIALRASQQEDSGPRDRLVSETIWLVRSLAAELLRAHHFSISHEDLESCGMRGLLLAADAFDDRRGTRFSTFAYYRIRGAMLDAIRDGHGECTRTEMARMRELGQRRGRSRVKTGPNDTVRSGSPFSAEPLERLTFLVADFCGHGFESATSQLLTSIAGSSAPDTPEEIVERIIVIERVRAAIGALPARERQIVELLYYQHQGSFEAVAKTLGVTRPHIFRIHARALAKLRPALAALAHP